MEKNNMDLSEKHRRLVEEIAGDAARAAGIRAADVAASESLGRGCSRRWFQRLPRTLQPRRRNPGRLVGLSNSRGCRARSGGWYLG